MEDQLNEIRIRLEILAGAVKLLKLGLNETVDFIKLREEYLDHNCYIIDDIE